MADFDISTPAIPVGGNVPVKFTCDGQNVSPEVTWTQPPQRTKSIALILEDPDAPNGTFHHWVLYNLQPDNRRLPEGSQPSTGTEGTNDAHKTSYSGPCPPPGPAHRYFFRLYALDLEPTLPPGLTAQALRETMESHILADNETMAKYQRQPG